jgi:hypothetical protein
MPDRAITAVAPAPTSERRRCRLSVNGTAILDIDSLCAGFWVTTLTSGSLVPKISRFYPALMNIRDGVNGCRTPEGREDAGSMVPGANALAGVLKWPKETDDILVVQSSGDMRGAVTRPLIEQLEAYGGRRISEIFGDGDAEENDDESCAFVLVGRYGLGYGLGHQVSTRGEARLQVLCSEDSWAGGRLLEGYFRKDCFATVDTFTLMDREDADNKEESKD